MRRVAFCSKVERIAPQSLGVKGTSEVLKSMATRTEFLSDTSHRLHFVYLPKHTSWLNQIEIIFGIVTKPMLRRGNFISVADLD